MRTALLALLLVAGCVSAGTKQAIEAERERAQNAAARQAEYELEIERLRQELVTAAAEDRNKIATEIAQLQSAKAAAEEAREQAEAKLNELDAKAAGERRDSAFGFADLLLGLGTVVLGGGAIAAARKKVTG